MTYIKGKTGLFLPAKTGKISSQQEISVEGIETWRSQLSLNDLTNSSKSLYLILKDCHQASLSYQQRFDILCLLRPTLAFINQSLQKHYSSADVLSENQSAIADLVNAIYFEMLNEYKIVIETVYRPFFCDKKTLLSALQNAMFCCTKILFSSYEQHRAPLQGIWLELHRLFVFAQEKGFANKTLTKMVFWHSQFKTIADIYKHSLLFSICNPNQLRHEQIATVSYAIETWAPLLTLRKANTIQTPLFVVDVTNDAPPCYGALYFTTLEDCYFMNLEKINQRISKLLSINDSSSQQTLSKIFTSSELALPKNFLESLSNSWQYLNEREYEREKIHGHISVCLGITATHWYLAQDLKLNPASIEETDSSYIQVIDIDILPSQQKALKHQIYVCELINQSEGGFCLKWSQEIPAQLQNDEIIGLEKKLDTGETHWLVGTIRWLKTQEDHSVLFGVEILNTHALPVKARLADAKSQHAIPTLLLPEQLEKKKPMVLITPPFPFKAGNEIEIEFENKTYPADLQKSYRNSSTYQEFEVQFLYQQLIFPHQAKSEARPIPSSSPEK